MILGCVMRLDSVLYGNYDFFQREVRATDRSKLVDWTTILQEVVFLVVAAIEISKLDSMLKLIPSGTSDGLFCDLT